MRYHHVIAGSSAMICLLMGAASLSAQPARTCGSAFDKTINGSLYSCITCTTRQNVCKPVGGYIRCGIETTSQTTCDPKAGGTPGKRPINVRPGIKNPGALLKKQ